MTAPQIGRGPVESLGALRAVFAVGMVAPLVAGLLRVVLEPFFAELIQPGPSPVRVG